MSAGAGLYYWVMGTVCESHGMFFPWSATVALALFLNSCLFLCFADPGGMPIRGAIIGVLGLACIGSIWAIVWANGGEWPYIETAKVIAGIFGAAVGWFFAQVTAYD